MIKALINWGANTLLDGSNGNKGYIPGRVGQNSSIANNSVLNTVPDAPFLKKEMQEFELDHPHHNRMCPGDIRDSQESGYDDSDNGSLYF